MNNATHDVTIRLWPEFADALAAWRAKNGDISTPDIIRKSYGIDPCGRPASQRRPSGDKLALRLEDDLFARCRDAAAVDGLPVREYLLRRMCAFVGVDVVLWHQGRAIKPRASARAANPSAQLPGDPKSRWPSGIDPVLVIARTDEWQRWWKDGGVPPFRVPANAGTTRYAEKTAERRDRNRDEVAA